MSKGKKSEYNAISDFRRREFLKKLGLGVSASMLLPFIPVLSASGAECPIGKRLIIFYTGDGNNGYNWEPNGTGANFQLSNVHEALNPHKSSLTLLVGMENVRGGPGDGHIQAGASMWTASQATDAPAGISDAIVKDPDSNGRGYYANTPSIDQTIANGVACYGDSPRKSYHLGVNIGAERTRTRVFQQGNRIPTHVETNINGILKDLFPSDLPSMPGSALGYREKIFDTVLFELESIKNLAPAADRPKFDQHITALQSSRQRLETESPPTNTNTCQSPVIDTSNWNGLEHDRQLKIMIPLAVNAMACDRTKIMCFQLNHSQNDSDDSDKTPLRIAGDGNNYSAYSGFVHGEQHGGNTLNIDRFYSSMFALLLQKLKEVPEGNGTMLDNTLVVWSRDLANGSGHGSSPIQTVLAGSAGGQIQTGRVINVNNEPNAKLFVSMGRLMGMQNFNSFGNLRGNSGALTQFFS
ncbi:MAG: DUF1552 domain-containing protein [Pseudomonadota bacterium]